MKNKNNNIHQVETIDPVEVAKFAQQMSAWWDPDGALKTLHDINPARMAFINQWVRLSGKRVLDVGCGGGILSEAMALEGAIVTGIDVEPHAIAAAIEHASSMTQAPDYRAIPIEAVEEGGFDVITCMEMLEHVPHPEVIIRHCARLLAPGGYLLLSTLNRTVKAYLSVVLAAEYVLGILPRQTHDFNKFIKPSELATMVRAAGLYTVGLSGLSYHPFTRRAALQKHVSVNYLMACRAP